MNKEEIKSILPHREPMLLVDSVELTEDGKAKGLVHIKGDEWFLQGHFPGNPVVPGVMLCEMMAQTTCVLLADGCEGATPFFTSLNNVKFKNKVLPGDTLEITCSLVNVKKPFYFAEGTGTVNGKLCVKADFSFALIKE